VVLIDAVRSGAPPGTVHRIDLKETRPGFLKSYGSTHGLGIAEAVELARSLNRLPETLILYGIEGENFEMGGGLTGAVDGALDRIVSDILGEIHPIPK
jgi:hydrogenase maturation protease